MKKSMSMVCHTELHMRHSELIMRHPEFISGSISYMQKKEMLNQVQHDGLHFGMTVYILG